MNARFLTISVALASVLVADASEALAQRIRVGGFRGVRAGRWYRAGVPRFYGGVPRYGVGWNPYGFSPYGYSGGTTPIGDARRGMAQMIRARGQASENYSRAMVNHQEARTKYIENQRKWIKAYYERKEIGEAHRNAENERRRASRDRYLAHLAKQRPERPHPTQVDPNNGKIAWPKALRTADFIELRQDVDKLFYVRAHTDATAGIANQVRAKTRAMKEILKGKIRDLPTSEYIAARKFLDLLATEARHPAT